MTSHKVEEEQAKRRRLGINWGAVVTTLLVGITGSSAILEHYLIPKRVDKATEAVTDSVGAAFDDKVNSLIEALPSIMASKELARIDSTPQASMERVLKLFHFGEERMIEHKSFKENELVWIRAKMAEDMGREPDFIRCGYALGKEGKPQFWVTCDNRRHKIFFDKPNRRLVNNVYYYIGDDGKAIILSNLSSVIIQ